jgi:hypothetical protein
MDQRYGPICNPVRRALSGVSELTIEGQFADASTTITGASYTKLLTFPINATCSLQNIERSMAVDPTSPHYEVYFCRDGNIFEGISRHGNNVS